MPIIRDLATVLVVIRSLRTEAHRQIVAGHPTGAVLDYLLDEIDQLADLIQPGQPDTRPAGQPDSIADTRAADTRNTEGGPR